MIHTGNYILLLLLLDGLMPQRFSGSNTVSIMALVGKTEGKEGEGGLAKQVRISRKILCGALCVIPVMNSKIRLEGKRTTHWEQQKDVKKQDASLKAFSQQMCSCHTHH